MRAAVFTAAVIMLLLATEGLAQAVGASSIAIYVPSDADDYERRFAEVFKQRIERRAEVSVSLTAAAGAGLRIYLWRYGHDPAFDGLAARHGLRLPGVARPAPEGFAVKSTLVDGAPAVLAMGADVRGTLYAVGEVLRRLSFQEDAVAAFEMDIASAPAYRWRGASANQGGTMRQITGAHAWTAEEWEYYLVDLALAGANTVYAGGTGFDTAKKYGLMVEYGVRPNQLENFPPEWQASERGNWVCPSIPEARKALLEKWDRVFAEARDYDVMRMFAGDPGGCRDERCAPWGKTFIRLAEEVAALWLKHHPNSTVQIANQDLDNEGDQAVFDYLNERPRKWLYAISYGPGSNAMSRYFRPELRDDLFEYPGHGPVNRYLAEILNQLPKYQRIVHYSDITHWISSQYQVEHPEPKLVRVYGRRTFHARPRAYYRIFQAVMPFSEGDILYSEGYHDEFHQYLWQRLLWDPNRGLDDVMFEYCRYHFGEQAAPLMIQALYHLEENLETPLETNPGIDQYYLLVKEAGWKIPSNYMKDNHRWRLHMQKAALDKYLQLRLRRELEIERELERIVDSRGEDGAAALNETLALLDTPLVTPEMEELRREAGRLGQESDALYGVRDVGYFNLDRPLTNLTWTATQLRRLRENAAAGPTNLANMVRQIVCYEDPGPGGFYDDAGEPGRQPRLVNGANTDAVTFLPPETRTSVATIAYARDPEGVVFRYTGLDPATEYALRFTLVSRPFRAVVKRTVSVLLDGAEAAAGLEIPVSLPAQHSMPVPRSVTADGELTVAFVPGLGSDIALVSEIWLTVQSPTR